jgi:hypothetical protein
MHAVEPRQRSPSLAWVPQDSRPYFIVVNLRTTVSLSWCQETIWVPWPDFFYLSNDCGFPLWREDRSVIYLYNCFWTLPKRPLSCTSSVELTAIFYCLIWDSPNLEGQVPVFISPRNRVAQLYSQALGYIFVASYDSQGYGGGILTRLHTGFTVCQSHIMTVRRPSETRDQFFFLLQILFRQLRVCYFVALSLTRGRACNLLLLLGPASAVPALRI